MQKSLLRERRAAGPRTASTSHLTEDAEQQLSNQSISAIGYLVHTVSPEGDSRDHFTVNTRAWWFPAFRTTCLRSPTGSLHGFFIEQRCVGSWTMGSSWNKQTPRALGPIYQRLLKHANLIWRKFPWTTPRYLFCKAALMSLRQPCSPQAGSSRVPRHPTVFVLLGWASWWFLALCFLVLCTLVLYENKLPDYPHGSMHFLKL